MITLSKLSINRQYFKHVKNDSIVLKEIHGFSNASPEAYGSCVYLKIITKSWLVQVSLVTSKSHASPIEKLTLPRTELLGNLLLSRLVLSVKKAFHPFITECKTFYWTDSSTSSSLIKTQKRN